MGCSKTTPTSNVRWIGIIKGHTKTKRFDIISYIKIIFFERKGILMNQRMLKKYGELEIPVDKISDTLKVSGRHISVDAPFVEGEDNSLLDGTQQYAKVLNAEVEKDFEMLERILS